MRNINLITIGLIIGFIFGILVFYHPKSNIPPGYQLVKNELIDSLNCIASLPPLIIRDTIIKVEKKVVVDTFWMDKPDSSAKIKWFEDSLYHPYLQVWHSIGYVGRIYATTWSFNPVQTIIRDSVRIFIPKLIETPCEENKIKWYGGLYVQRNIGGTVLIERDKWLLGVGFSIKGEPMILSAYRFK